MSGFGIDRMAMRMLTEARALTVPTMVADVAPISRVALFRAGIGAEPDKWQIAVMESVANKLLLNCCRQSGKSTVSSTLAVHEAATVPGALVLMLSPSLRQSAELFRKCLAVAKTPDIGLPRITQESALRLEMENESRIVALPGSSTTVRGYSAATLVVIDEASRVPDELMAAVRPTLATTNGRVIALSTPAGKRGWFYLEYTSGVGWERTRITSDDCHRISEEFLADERRLLGEWVFMQEYHAEFYDAETAVFSSDLIAAAITSDVTPLWPELVAV